MYSNPTLWERQKYINTYCFNTSVASILDTIILIHFYTNRRKSISVILAQNDISAIFLKSFLKPYDSV